MAKDVRHPRRRPLQSYLLALIVLTLAIAFTALAAWGTGMAFHETPTTQPIATSKTVARAVESEHEPPETMLTALQAVPASTTERQPDRMDNAAMRPGDRSGSFMAVASEADDAVLAFQLWNGTSGGIAVVGETLKASDARWQLPPNSLGIGAGIALLLALLAVSWIVRQVLQPAQALAQHSAAVPATGGPGPQMDADPLQTAPFEAPRESIAGAENAEAERTIAHALSASERRYRALAEVGALVFWRRDSAGNIISATGWAELTGQPEPAAYGSEWLDRIHPGDRAVVDRVWYEANAKRCLLDVEFRIAGADGQWRWVRGRGASLLHEDGSVDEWVGVLEDVDARRQAQARIAHMAQHDALTGLPNRLLFRERMEEAVARAAHGQAEAVLYIDLDRFKEVNDVLGHPVGDALLCAVTERLLQAVQASDTVARLGGDEFAIVQTAATQPAGASALADRLVDDLSRPYELLGHQVLIGASLGIALINPGDDAGHALQNADMALYRAKDEGRGRFSFFEPAMRARMQDRRRAELALRRAIAEREFEIHYQPQVKASTRDLVGFEALLRWNHGERGLLQPADFLPMAEEIGLTVPIGEWVLLQACMEAAKWPGHLRVAVNISSVQLAHRGLADAVSRALLSSGLAPRRLELEVTENTLLENVEVTTATLFALKALGVKIAMDDFGNDSSSLGYLRAFPFDKIKIDASLIKSLGDQEKSRAIIKAVSGLCENLGITTTAEGVETGAQFDFLASEQCTEVQGFLFSKPCSASDVLALCETLAPTADAAGSRRTSQTID